MPKTLFIIDAYNLIYRMFYAIPEMTTRSGEYVNAIFGIAKFLKWLAEENPDASILVATDVGKTFRSDLYPDYKAQRDRMPDNLRSQIEAIFKLFEYAHIPVIAREGYEADDIIGSIAHQHENDDYQIVIISSDKDLCQFVRDGKVHIYDAMKRKFMKESDVLEKFWVPTHQVRDFLAIVGDSSDNIPGIAGFWQKKAIDLLSKYSTLQWIYEHREDLTEKMREIFEREWEIALISQKLATICVDLDIGKMPEVPLSENVSEQAYIDFLIQYEFRSLLPKWFESQKTEILDIESTEITTYDQLQEFFIEIQSWLWEVIISTDASSKKFSFSYIWRIVSMDSEKIDLSEFFSTLEKLNIVLVSYDIKAILKHIDHIKNPLGWEDLVWQGRLF